MIRLESRESKDDEGRSRGWLSGLRYITVTPITFPEDFCLSHEELVKHCRIVKAFAKSCRATLDLVREIANGLSTLAVAVVRQYYIVTCLRFEHWATERAGQQGDMPSELEELRVEVAALRLALERAGQPARALSMERTAETAAQWVALTIFHIAFAALAAPLDPSRIGEWSENVFEKYAARTDVGHRWLVATKWLRPSAIAIDFTSRTIGTSVARWRLKPAGKHSLFERWEKQVRTAGMAADAQATLYQARVALLELSSKREPPMPERLPWEEVHALALAAFRRVALAPTFAAQCTGKVWLTVHGDGLRPFAQCAACRVKYVAVELPVSNARADGGRAVVLGDNWDTRDRWQPAQCAEDDLYAQLFLAAHAATLPDVAVAPRARITEAPLKPKLSVAVGQQGG